MAVCQFVALTDVAHRHLVAALRALDAGRDRVRHCDDQIVAVAFAADDHFTTVWQQLDAVIDRVLEQGLNRQARNQCAHRQIGDVPAYFQAIAESQFFDALINCGELEFLFQRRTVFRAPEVGAQQVGQVLDGFLGLARIRARQRGDRVHAVEQEMWANERLQGTDARLRFEHDAAAPLAGHVQITHRQGDDDRADRNGTEQEAEVRVLDNHGFSENASQLISNFSEHEAHHKQNEETHHESACFADTFEAAAQHAHEGTAEQREPEH